MSKDKPQDQQKVSRTLSTLKVAETVTIHPQRTDTSFSRSNSMTPKLASEEHEAQLKRLMELQQGFVRSTRISESALESIRAKKEKIKKSQSLADKRRELAKKAVAAQDDEQMFQALFETVHTDLRSQQKSLEEAKQAIEN